jgi:hypothetical protein
VHLEPPSASLLRTRSSGGDRQAVLERSVPCLPDDRPPDCQKGVETVRKLRPGVPGIHDRHEENQLAAIQREALGRVEDKEARSESWQGGSLLPAAMQERNRSVIRLIRSSSSGRQSARGI